MSKILVVDDEPTVRRILRRTLEKAGYTVIELADGAGVAELVRLEAPDLVLLDIHMPKLDGIAALLEIHDIDPRIQVIAMTGDTDPKRAKLAVESGACAFISKPFELEFLLTAVMVHLVARRG